MARLSEFSQETADLICERIADGESLRSICEAEDMPAKSTVFKWLGLNEAFADQYARARQAQADALFDDILSIADDRSNDWTKRAGTEEHDELYEINGEAIQRAKLRIDSRKWMAGKLRPKVYGEKLELSGDPENPLTLVTRIELVAPDDHSSG